MKSINSLVNYKMDMVKEITRTLDNLGINISNINVQVRNEKVNKDKSIKSNGKLTIEFYSNINPKFEKKLTNSDDEDELLNEDIEADEEL